MPAQILDGKGVAEEILMSLIPRVKELDPALTIVQVGDDPASATYIRHKLKACERIHMRAEHLHLEASTSFKELLTHIKRLNGDTDVTGFILQLPLPSPLKKKLPQIIRTIDPMKDVDGFTAYNLGKVFLSTEFEHLPPATPAGVIHLLEHFGIAVKGKHAVVVGHSNLVGKPLAVMLLNRDATVTVCHLHTTDLASHTRQADILCTAVGKPNLITSDMVKPGAVVIDIGMSQVQQQHGSAVRLVGDVDFDAVKDIASAITPVPGGIGPMTVASLLRNVIRAKERQDEAVGL